MSSDSGQARRWPLIPAVDEAAPGKGAGLYVHVPFCLRKCRYCDFNSQVAGEHTIAETLAAMAAEMALYAEEPAIGACRFATLYIGGGTPTALSTAQLTDLVGRARSLARLTEEAEVSCEANPGTVDQEKLLALRRAGVNRLSFGVQSFDAALLAELGRIHSPDTAVESVRAARAAGFGNINIDLMFGLPGQTLERWQQTVDQALALAPEHLSCYSLIVEETTPFGALQRAGKLVLPDEDTEAEMYDWVQERLQREGYEHYEVSNFARPGYRCQHNEIYWRNEWFLGIGCGAHSRWGQVRWENESAIAAYVGALRRGHLPVGAWCHISLDDDMDTVMMMGLRLRAGVSEARFGARFGVRMADVYGETIAALTKRGLVHYDGRRLALTARGLELGNHVFAAFMRN